MSTPTWATVIGVIMLLLGGCGAIQNVQKIYTPSSLEEMSGEFEQIEYELNRELGRTSEPRQDSTDIDTSGDYTEKTYEPLSEEDSAGIAMFEGMFGSVSNLLTFSDFYKTWIVRLGIIGLIASLIYAIGGLLLVMGKSFAVKAALGALAFSTLSSILQIVIFTVDKESGFAVRMSSISSYLVIFVNVILLIIILASDKTYFEQIEEEIA